MIAERVSIPNLYLIIPLFNEEENLPRLLGDFEAFNRRYRSSYNCRLVTVDDGSTDRSREILSARGVSLPLTVLENSRNLGPGRSFARAFEWLASHLAETDLVATMEADNTSGFDTLSRMLTRIREGYEVVSASPYSYGGGFEEVSTLRILISHVANGLVKLSLGIHGLNTFSSFFRLYRAGTIRSLQDRFGAGIIESAGFECMVELIYKLVLLRTAISELEFKVDWGKRRGKSKMRLMRTIRGYYSVFLKKKKWRNSILENHL